MKYPSLETVDRATQIDLAKWVRYLPSPGWKHIGMPYFSERFRSEEAVLSRIIKRFDDLGGWTPEVSKTIEAVT